MMSLLSASMRLAVMSRPAALSLTQEYNRVKTPAPLNGKLGSYRNDLTNRAKCRSVQGQEFFTVARIAFTICALGFLSGCATNYDTAAGLAALGGGLQNYGAQRTAAAYYQAPRVTYCYRVGNGVMCN